MSVPNDLQTLLANIRPRPSPPSDIQETPSQDSSRFQRQTQPNDGKILLRPQLQGHGYQHPSVSSAIHSPSSSNTQPHGGSDVLSPNIPALRGDAITQEAQMNPSRAVNLLNLLKVDQAATSNTNQLGSGQSRPTHSRNVSASDLVASLLGSQNFPSSTPGSATSQYSYIEQSRASGGITPIAPTAENTQDMLLRLLNRQKPSQAQGGEPKALQLSTNSPESGVPDTITLPQRDATPSDIDLSKRISKEPDVSAPKRLLFSFTNPFDQLAAVSPRAKSPASKSQGENSGTDRLRDKNSGAVAGALGSNPTLSGDDYLPHLAEGQREAVTEVVGRLVEQIVREVDQVPLGAVKKETPPVRATQKSFAKAAASSAVSPPLNMGAEAKSPRGSDEPGAVRIAAGEMHKNTDELVDSWENAEESAEKDEERVIPVYNFPLRPFISICVKPNNGKLPHFQDDGIMDISRLKKDFDQLDRSLTSATSDYIVYALAKNGGIRIIRQDDGRDKQIFRFTRDRIFNVALCTSSGLDGVPEEQAVLGIGVSGTVYWAMISRPDKDVFDLDALDSESLIFPPFPAWDENTSGGQLKTRAKQSSRHPGIFAIGRGKSIYVISPLAAAGPSYGVSASQRSVNTEKFFKERAVKISTGKAGKDFTFSDDDTVIASLDKTGRLRFWDVREAVNSAAFLTNGPSPTEIRVPLNTFITGAPSEKSWPTSVLFIDKLRPYVKSLALRYVLVGMKQNHTLQLWDIGLGKAVQELNFPHENESDAICGIAYHAASGIIVVAHPTRNSIYFIHLSAPRYNLQPMSQAAFIKQASEKDSTLPKPDSTACMSGIREISFASKGQLRSFDLLPASKSAGEKRGMEDDNSLFELYVMHSKGVTCLNIKKEDLGWSSDNRIIRPINALEESLIDIANLQSYPANIADDPSINGDSVLASVKPNIKDAGKKPPESSSDVVSPGDLPNALPSNKQSPKKKPGDDETISAPNGSEKAERRKKRKGGSGDGAAKAKDTNTMLSANEASSTDLIDQEGPSKSYTLHNTTGFSPRAETVKMDRVDVEPVATSSEALGRHLEAFQGSVWAEFSKSLGREFQGLYRRFDEERRAWDVSAAAKQDQVLRLVSSTLSDNVEKNLARIVADSIESQVLPTVNNATTTVIGEKLNEVIMQQFASTISRELRKALPDAVSRVMKQPDVMKNMLDTVSDALTAHVGSEMQAALQNTLMPSLRSMVEHIAGKIGSDTERRIHEQAKQYEAQRQTDAAKISQLTSLIHGLSDTVSSMAAAQTSLQGEVLRLCRALDSRRDDEDISGTQHHQPSRSISATASQPKSAEDSELAEISMLISEGKHEEGSVKWLQSRQQANLFDNFFVRLDPAYLADLSPIVGLSVGVAVTSSLQTNTVERLRWLEVVFRSVNFKDADLHEIAPRIMDILVQRLEALYMTIAQNDPHNPILRKIPPLSRRARELVD